jgi:hypothetical protein
MSIVGLKHERLPEGCELTPAGVRAVHTAIDTWRIETVVTIDVASGARAVSLYIGDPAAEPGSGTIVRGHDVLLPPDEARHVARLILEAAAKAEASDGV